LHIFTLYSKIEKFGKLDNFFMKKLYIFFFSLLCISAFSVSSIQQARAQLTVTPGSALGMTPLQLVQNVLVGNGITVSNATFNGSTANISSNMIGRFFTTGGATTQLGLTGGILLTTGKAIDAIGPNSTETSGTGTATGTDADLQLMVPATVYDKAVLEFDFIPMSSDVSFRYVFGSEEFDEFCGSQYNDVFGFFISGPGISGPYSNSAINIAVMPNNPANAVTISNICSAGATYSWLNASGTFYQYDRLTYIYTASGIVQPCQTYHIKLAIADAVDMFFDSGVFLEENSFSANEVSDEVSYSSTIDTIAIEGCNDAIITFHLSNIAASPITINHTIGGSAIEGVDYLDIPDNFIIPTGQDSMVVVITPIADGNPEATETVVINYSTSICGAQSTIVILIKDYTFMSTTTTADYHSCDGQATTIGVTATGGYTPPPLTYLWSENAGTTASVTIGPGTNTMYYVTVSDVCNKTIVDSVMVTIGVPLNLTTTMVPETCNGDDDGSATVTGTTGFAPYHYQWSPAGDTTATAVNLGAGTYTVTVTDSYGCSNTASVNISVTPTDDPAFNYSSSFYCQSGTDPSANITGGSTGTFTSTPPGLVFLNSATGQIDVSASAVNTYTITFTTNGVCPASSTAIVSITTAPSAVFNYAGPYCQNVANPSPTLGPGANTGTFSATPAGLVFVSTSTGQVNLTASTPGTYTVTNSIAAANGCVATSATASIIINPVPNVTVPANITVCNNNSIAGTNFISTPAGATFAWTNSNTAIGLAAGGSGNIASFTATNTGTTPISATITVVPTLNNCTGPSSTYTITVNPTPTVTVPANITVCNNGIVSATNFVSTPTGGTIAWTNSNTAIGLAASGSGNIPSFTATNSGTAPITATITVIATLNNCAGLSSTYTITVNPTPTVTVPANITVCNNGTVAATNFVTTPSGGTFTWTNSNTGIGIGGSGSGNIASFTATNSGTSTISATITVVPTYNNCVGTSSTYTITVIPSSTVNVPANITVCNGDAVPGMSFSSPTPSATFAWTNSNTAIGLPGSGSGNIAGFTATNTGTAPITATITVTPTANNCAGTASSYTITVKPTPTVIVPADITACNGATIPATAFTSPTPGTTYSWTNSNVAIGIVTSGTGNIPAFTATNSGTAPISASITVTPSYNGCVGTPSTYTITVNPTPIVYTPANITVCHGDVVPASLYTSTVAGTTYSWTNSNTAIGLAASGTGNTPSFTANNTGTGAALANLTVTPSVNNCAGIPVSYTIMVNPVPMITFSPMPEVCITSPAFTLTQASPSGGTYSGTGITGGTFDPAVAGIGTHTITYDYTNPVTGCSNTNTTQIIISGSLTITVTPTDPFICDGNSVMLTADGAYYFNWLPDTNLSSSNSSNVVASPTSTTTYTVVGNNPNGCIGSNTVTVGVYSVPMMLVTSAPKEGCTPLDVTFGYGPAGQIDTNTIIWNFGDFSSANNASSLTAPTHTYNINGNFTINFSAQTTDGCPVIAADTVKVYLRPIADFYNYPLVAYADNPILDFIDLSVNPNSWEWNFGDPGSHNSNYSNIQNTSHIFSDTGTYMVQLIVFSDNSCSDTIEKPVIVYPEIIVYIPNAFTPNEDDLNDTFIPIISGASKDNYEFYIYDRWGRLQFFTDNANTAWDGKNKDKYNEAGVYVYYLVYYSVTGVKHKRKGFVTLVR